MSEEKNNTISSDFFENTEKIERQRMYEFVVSFNSLMKSLKLYGAKNDTVLSNIAKFRETLKFFFITEKSMTLSFNGNDFYINDIRIKKKKNSQLTFDDLEDFFIFLQIASISFPSTTKESSVLNFIFSGQETIGKKLDPDAVFDHFQNTLNSKNIDMVISRRDSSGGDDLFSILDKSQMARLLYRNLVNDHQIYRSKIKEKRPIPIRKALRNIQNAIDLLIDGSEDSQESQILTLSSLNSLKSRYIATHLANTSLLAIAAGAQLGIERDLLTRIGVAAYFHDIAIPENSQGENVEHSTSGFAYLSRLNSLNFAMMEAAITAGLHHRTYSFEGNPIVPEKPLMSTPLGEIIKVCDYYDLVTRWWPSKKGFPMKRTNAIVKIFEMAEKKCFSAVAAKALFSAVGLFPPGTILRVAKKNQLACSIDVFKNTGKKSKAAVLDKDMNFLYVSEFLPQELLELPDEIRFRTPPFTVKSILDSFENNNEN
jgi:HD-GYP domain-containing protein (c-di-GMP phosphodiesterase class II)